LSSAYTRTEFKGYLTANWTGTNTFKDISDFETIDDFPNPPEEILVLEFVSVSEQNISLGPRDCYRERGAINCHILVPSGYDSTNGITICENLRNLLRGIRINNVVIESITPPTNRDGAALSVDGIYDGWAVSVSYYTDFFYI